MNLIKKIHTVIKLLRTKLRKIFIQTKLNKSSVAQNHHYHFNHPNLFDKLCTLYGTDKGFLEFEGTKPYGYRPHTYSTVYHNLFDHCKENINLVFECGIGTNDINIRSNMTASSKPGASLRVWKNYFPKAQIYGADIDDKILFQEERIFTFQVDQLNSLSIEKMWSNINKSNFDLIVDDGLHTSEAGFNLFLNSFEKLRSGGIYIIEDVHYSYLRDLTIKLNNYNPEVIILQNKFFNQYNIKSNNLILIRKL
jgi:hypothetical protein